MLREPGARERILRAGLEEIAAQGIAGARTARIAARAGVNKQLIHYYFRTKSGLYEAVLAEAAASVATQLKALPLVGLTAVERLRRLVRGQFEFFHGHPEHAAVLAAAKGDGKWADLAVQPLADLLERRPGNGRTGG